MAKINQLEFLLPVQYGFLRYMLRVNWAGHERKGREHI